METENTIIPAEVQAVKKKNLGGRPKSDQPTKDRQLMTRVTDATAEELERIAVEMDRSVSWILNDLAKKFIAQHESAQGRKDSQS